MSNRDTADGLKYETTTKPNSCSTSHLFRTTGNTHGGLYSRLLKKNSSQIQTGELSDLRRTGNKIWRETLSRKVKKKYMPKHISETRTNKFNLNQVDNLSCRWLASSVLTSRLLQWTLVQRATPPGTQVLNGFTNGNLSQKVWSHYSPY